MRLVGCADSVADDVLQAVSSVDDSRGDGEGVRLKEPMDDRCADSAAGEVPQAISSGDYSRGDGEEPMDDFEGSKRVHKNREQRSNKTQ